MGKPFLWKIKSVHGWKSRFFLLYTLLCLSFSAFSQQEPEPRVSLPRKPLTVYDALKQITDQTCLMFIYDSRLLDSRRRVRVEAHDEPVTTVLTKILNDRSLSFERVGRHVVITKTKPEVELIAVPASSTPAETDYLIISGRVFDEETKEPIPFASIGLADYPTGTISNEDGYFLLKYPADIMSSTFFISHLGYKRLEMPVDLVGEKQMDHYLERSYISIQEVVIRYIDPVSVLQKFRESRSTNYSTEPYYQTAFYREGIQKNSRTVSYSEGVFQIYKTPVTASSADRVKLLKARNIKPTQKRDSVSIKLKGGVQAVLMLDISKNLPDFLDKDFESDYNYVYNGLTSYNGRTVYEIAFKQREYVDQPLYRGIVYIAENDYALVGADFEVNPEYLQYATNQFIISRPRNITPRIERVEYTVRYEKFEEAYYISHIRSEIDLTTRIRSQWRAQTFSTFIEFAAFGVDHFSAEKFARKEQLKTNTIFSDQQYTYDPEFWGAFNYIQPEAKLSESLERLKSKVEELE